MFWLFVYLGCGFTLSLYHHLLFVRGEDIPMWIKFLAFLIAWMIWPYTFYHIVKEYPEK